MSFLSDDFENLLQAAYLVVIWPVFLGRAGNARGEVQLPETR